MQVTVVPRPTAESSFTVPPCSSTKERTIDRPRPGAAMLRAERMALEPVEHPLADLGRNAGAAIRDAEHDRVVAPLDGQPHHLARAARS